MEIEASLPCEILIWMIHPNAQKTVASAKIKFENIHPSRVYYELTI